jgi:hypothetical protein
MRSDLLFFRVQACLELQLSLYIAIEARMEEYFRRVHGGLIRRMRCLD